MKVTVTLDYYDGSQGKSVVIDAEDMPVRDLMFKMMNKDVCGFTVTKTEDVVRLMSKMHDVSQ